ncbi:family 20 glycosylhydrolase [Reichenbachiella sp.]|uniref:glycoside hydrolase family 20 protein n=1 Tax=Reichenbachiella sp. TaxID=2184521 RepID=UPI003BB02614
MNNRKTSVLLALTLWMLLVSCSEPIVRKKISIIPRPDRLIENKDLLRINDEIQVVYLDESLAFAANYLADQLGARTKKNIVVEDGTTTGAGTVFLTLDSTNTKEGYSLAVNNTKATLSASTPAGAFYAVQSLLQLVQSSGDQFFLPGVEIEDEPRFAWRGMHLDVSRHFFGVDKIKKYIDYLSMYKLNTFHWHLTDDQGWRIEIKKYPLLTEKASWRASVGFPSNQAKGLDEDDGKPYGGFYTQEEVKEIIKYAQDRQVTIVPEIEMPAHTSAVLKAYPELACEGLDLENIVREGTLSRNVFCAGKEETFEFLQNVMDEVLTLFPSEYIHVGGDEAPKDHWEECSLCQKRIKTEQLADEHELQSYFITRMEKYLNAKGRKLIGWDEILEGGLAPNAAVMSWRGVAGGIAAAQAHHEAVMTPGFPLYFNHRPIDLKNSPGHSSTNNTITTVYNYEPVPEELSAEEAKYVIGVQANIWTEYIPKWEHVESLLFPRLLSLSEIAWTSADRKDFEDFRQRLPYQLERLDEMDVNYGKDPFQVGITMQLKKSQQQVSLSTELPGLEIRYTTDGTAPSSGASVYSEPFACTKTSTIKAASFVEGRLMSEISSVDYLSHKATGKRVEYENDFSEKYDGGGDFGLVDGRFGFEESISFAWQGFVTPIMEATVDLEEITTINSISAGFLSDQRQWIFQPDQVIFEVSDDGKHFQIVFDETFSDSRKESVIQKVIRPTAADLTAQGRYVRVRAINHNPIPEWHAGVGKMPWIFVDELVVE